MKIHTELQERYGKARIIARYNAETNTFLDFTVLDANRHIIIKTTDYKKAKDILMTKNIER